METRGWHHTLGVLRPVSSLLVAPIFLKHIFLTVHLGHMFLIVFLMTDSEELCQLSLLTGLQLYHWSFGRCWGTRSLAVVGSCRGCRFIAVVRKVSDTDGFSGVVASFRRRRVVQAWRTALYVKRTKLNFIIGALVELESVLKVGIQVSCVWTVGMAVSTVPLPDKIYIIIKIRENLDHVPTVETAFLSNICI